jgi:Mrp family chromosome partitioning ATPase
VTPFLLVSRSAEYESRLRSLLGARLDVVTGEFLTFGASSVVDRVDGTPRIALLGPVLNYEETHGLAEELTSRHPDVGLIVVREQRSDLEDWVDELALHAVLSPDASDETTLELIERLSAWLVQHGKASSRDFEPPAAVAAHLADPVRQEVETPFDALAAGDVAYDELTQAPPVPTWDFPPLEAGTRTEAIAVVAPKGGQGKTTLSINLATGLAEIAPNSVVLVDADLQFGDIATALSLEPDRTIVDAVADAAADEIVLKTSLTHHDAGFFVVAGAPSPELGDAISTAALGLLIERLRTSFRYVVVDTTPGLGEHTLATLEHVTDAVFVTNMSVPSLRAMRT